MKRHQKAHSLKSPLLLGYLTLILLICCNGCVPKRPPVPIGTVPTLHEVSAEDEQYGNQVLEQLTQQYQLSKDDGGINRVRDIVDRLTSVRPDLSQAPWHTYVLEDDNMRNAAATRGNFIIVWTGMIKSVRNDEELAAVLAHEIGHVLAGHPTPEPAEQANDIISGVAGVAARQAVQLQGSVGALAGLAELLVRESMKAMIVNPESQRKELEADQIGLFLMADAHYNPERAVDFWRRAAQDPNFSSGAPELFSSHPASQSRVIALEKILPQALHRYRTSR